MIEDGLIRESSDNRLKMQFATNRDLLNFTTSLLKEALDLQETLYICPGANADKNKVTDLQDITTIECAGILNWMQSACESTFDLFGKALNLPESLLCPRAGDKSPALVENDIIFDKDTIWVSRSLFQAYKLPTGLLEFG